MSEQDIDLCRQAGIIIYPGDQPRLLWEVDFMEALPKLIELCSGRRSAVSYLTINYLQNYTKLRMQEMSFHEFMALINQVYEFGHQRGVLHGIETCKQEIEAQMKAKEGQ